MTITLPSGGSPTLEALFKNCVTEEQVQEASVKNLRGPFHVGELTAFVFRPLKDNGEKMRLAVLEDTGLASGEGGSQEVDMNQLSPDEMQTRAQRWFQTQVQRGNFNVNQVVAVVYDGSRTSSPELSGLDAQDTLKATLNTLSKPDWMERAVAAVKHAFAPSHA